MQINFLVGPNTASFCLFSFLSQGNFSTNSTVNDFYVDGVLGIWTRGGRIVGIDESAELWQRGWVSAKVMRQYSKLETESEFKFY